MLNDTILFARLAETNLASYGSRLKGMCEGIKVNTVIELLRLYQTDSISDTIPYCGWTMKASFEMFCSDILSMTEQEQQEMTQKILQLRKEHPLKRTYIIPCKISQWVEEIYQEFIHGYPSVRIREKFLAMYYNADRFYDSILFHPDKAFYWDIDGDLEVVKEIWQFTIYVAQFLTDSILKNRQLSKTDAFRRKCEEFVENLHICHLEAYNRLNYHLSGKSGQKLIQNAYNLRVSVQDDDTRQRLETPEAMERIIFGHPEMVWKTYDALDGLSNKSRGMLKENFESLYTYMADLAHHSPKENDKLYLNQMFDFLEPYQEDRVMEYIRDNNNTPILYLILAYVRSRPTGSYMDVLARFNGFFGPEQTIEQIASSLGARRNRIVALFQNPEADSTLRGIASYPEAKRYNLAANDWVDLTEPMSLLDEDEKALVEKLNASDEALYYALSTLCQVELVPMLDRMVGIAPELVEEMDFAAAITSLWKTKFKYSDTQRVVEIPDIVSMYLQVPKDYVKNMERIERVFIGLVRLIMPDLQLGYPNIIIPPSKVNAEAELFKFVSLMKEIRLDSLFDIFTSNYPQFNLKRPEALIPVIELSGKIGYNPRKRKFMPRGDKTVKYPYDHLKDTAIKDRSWIDYQDINGVDEPQVEMPSQGTKDLTYEQITTPKVEEEAPKAAPKIKESTDIKSALQAALAITAKLTDVESIGEPTTEYNADSVSNEEAPTTPVIAQQENDDENDDENEEENKEVVFETEEPKPVVEEETTEVEATTDTPEVEQSMGLVTDNVEEVISVTKEEENASEETIQEEPNIADLLEDFGAHNQTDDLIADEDKPQPVAEETLETKVEEAPEITEDEPLRTEESSSEELTSEEQVQTIVEEQPILEDQPIEEVVEEAPVDEMIEETPLDEMIEETPLEDVVEETPVEEVIEETPVEDVVEETPVSELTSTPATEEPEEKVTEETAQAPEEPKAIVEEQVELTNELPEAQVTEQIEVESLNEEPQVEEPELKQAEEPEQSQAEATEQFKSDSVDAPVTKEVVFETAEEPSVEDTKEEPKDEVPTFVTEAAKAARAPITIVSEESGSKTSTSTSTQSAKAKKNSKDIVVVKEPQAEMSPYRQSLVLEEKKAEEEKKEKEKGKRGRKPLPKPQADLPLKDNILIILRNSKAPMTLPNIVKSLRKAGLNPVEDDVADIIYKFDKQEFLFFMRDFIGLMEKKYNFNLYRLDPKSYNTFDYMGRAFFEFCDRNCRMPFMENEEERFLDRWVSHLLDEKVKCTPQQMKWFRKEVVSRRGKVLNKEEWTFVDNCQKYRKYYQEHKTRPNPSTDAALSKWFARASQNYKTLNEIKRSEFDSLIEYLDQFSLFGLFD